MNLGGTYYEKDASRYPLFRNFGVQRAFVDCTDFDSHEYFHGYTHANPNFYTHAHPYAVSIPNSNTGPVREGKDDYF